MCEPSSLACQFKRAAGSERVGKTHSEGLVLKEAGYINKSLTFLEQVVIALSTPNRDHVPYRRIVTLPAPTHELR